MELTRMSLFTGKVSTREIDCTKDQLFDYYNNNDKCIQDAFPNLSVDDREFIMTGCSPEEWNSLLGPEDDDHECVPSK